LLGAFNHSREKLNIDIYPATSGLKVQILYIPEVKLKG
jgi:hypothetical protein